MGYIRIPVEKNLEKLVEWFSSVHVGDGIDFRLDERPYNRPKEVLVLYNSEGQIIEVAGYDEKELIKSIDERAYMNFAPTDWNSVVRHCMASGKLPKSEKPVSYFAAYMAYLNEDHVYRDIGPAWFVGDIGIEGKADGDMVILLSITPFKPKEHETLFEEIKRDSEDDLLRLLSENNTDVSIPYSLPNRYNAVAKMYFALKGSCEFRRVSDLYMINRWILQNKYPDVYAQAERNNVIEYEGREEIPEITYEFPPELTVQDIISQMGRFQAFGKDRRAVLVCRENIRRTLRNLKNDSRFRSEILHAAGVLAVARMNEDERAKRHIRLERPSLEMEMAEKLMEEMVIKHELGHMVFREIIDDPQLVTSNCETLANWFSCLFTDGLQRRMIELLVPHQSKKYHHFISIPRRNRMGTRKYDAYAREIEALLRSW